VILLCILSGRYPFFKAVDDNMAIMQLVSLFGVESVRKSALKYGESFLCSYDKKPTDLKDICTSLRSNTIKALRVAKAKRKGETATDLSHNIALVSQFPDSAYDLLKKLLELDCEKRLSAESALNHPFFK
jgi:cell division control protein 7